jgi:hypothetical protein
MTGKRKEMWRPWSSANMTGTHILLLCSTSLPLFS